VGHDDDGHSIIDCRYVGAVRETPEVSNNQTHDGDKAGDEVDESDIDSENDGNEEEDDEEDEGEVKDCRWIRIQIRKDCRRPDVDAGDAVELNL
jgi:hypothetical protein